MRRILARASSLVLMVRTVVAEPYTVPSGSMIPTLLVGDELIASKYAYGYSKYSLPLSVPLFDGRIWSGTPARGDIVVFRLPKDDSTDYIKRVIGLPGDRVQMKNDVLYLNGKPVPREKVEDYVGDLDGVAGRWTQYRETLPGGERLVLAMDREVPFLSDRISGPDRVFVDLAA